MIHSGSRASVLPLFAAVAFAAGCTDSPVSPQPGVAAPTVTASLSSSAADPAASVYRVDLSSLNGSGVHGTATISVRDGALTVVLNAVGHEVGEVHAQHIHGFTDETDGSCPPAGFDPDGDGVLTVGEGAAFYGPVQLPLTPFPAPANRGGAISYHATFSLDDLVFTPDDLVRKSMVLHGATVAGAYVGSLPVACGTVEAVN